MLSFICFVLQFILPASSTVNLPAIISKCKTYHLLEIIQCPWQPYGFR